MRLDHEALAEVADAQAAPRTLKFEQHVIPGQGRLARGCELLFDLAERQRMRADKTAPGANYRITLLLLHDPSPWSITDICICKYNRGTYVCKCNHSDCDRRGRNRCP